MSKLPDSVRARAKKYLEDVSSQLDEKMPLIVPHISGSHDLESLKNVWRFAPHDIWLFRHLGPMLRLLECREFKRLGNQMRDSDPKKDAY